MTFVGMMFNASKEVSHFFNCTRSLSSAIYVVRRLATHALEMIRYGRAQRLTNGNALIARLARSAYDKSVEIRTETPVSGLIIGQSRSGKATVIGVEVSGDGNDRRQLYARKAVVLASGGFPQDPVLKQHLFEHAPTGHEHVSPAPPGNTGDGWRLAESAGGQTFDMLPNNAAWIPVSKVPHGDGKFGVFPHLVDRYKPGIIAVLANGQRFVNEANSYHDFGCALRQACQGGTCEAWLICDDRTINRYGLGYAKPFPVPKGGLIKSGYLIRARTIQDLALQAGINSEGLLKTVELVNRDAATGVDTHYGKGSTAYNRFLGDPSHLPNPCFAEIEKGPFYAVKVVMGDLGTFAGVRTDENGQVIGSDGSVVPGLYCVGNDALSVMGGAYPGGGITLGPAMTFGYRAAQSISKKKETT
nr:FAD-binding protein [Orrella marina]